MAIKVFKEGVIVKITGLYQDDIAVNPYTATYQINSDIFTIKDNGKSYQLGTYTNFQNEEGDSFASQAAAAAYIGKIINSPMLIEEWSGAIFTADEEHYYINNGYHFNVFNILEGLTNGEVTNFTIVTPSAPKYVHLNFNIYSTQGVKLELYVGSTGVSGGTVATARNNNNNSANTSDAVVTINPTVTGYGLNTAVFLAGASRTAGFTEREKKYILLPSSTYCVKATSLGNSNSYSYGAEWLEIEKYI